MAGSVKDSEKVRSHGWQRGNVSLVSRREDELCGELARPAGRVYLGLLTRCQAADIAPSVGVAGVTLSLSGHVCVWTYVFEWEEEGGRQ